MGYDAGRFLTPSRSAVALDSLLQPEIPVGTVMLSIVCFYLSSLTARAQFVEHHGQDDDCALDNQLPVKGDVHPGGFFISSRKPATRSVTALTGGPFTITICPLPLRRSATYLPSSWPACLLLDVTVASTPPSAPTSTATTVTPAAFARSTAGAIPLLCSSKGDVRGGLSAFLHSASVLCLRERRRRATAFGDQPHSSRR